MKSTEKKQANQQVKPQQTTNDKKQSSGDIAFDNAIDRMLKKPALTAPAK